MAATRLWTKTFTGALSETSALLSTADSNAEGSSIHALVDGSTGTLKIYYTFGFGTNDEKTVLYQTVALADGVLSVVNFQYKVPYYHVTFTGAGSATAWVDVTTF